MLVGFQAQNHPQQTRYAGSNPDVDDRALPVDDFAVFNERFRFTVDAASSIENRKCERHWTVKENGLAQSWAGERVYCNPPYSDIGPWIRQRCFESCEQLIYLRQRSLFSQSLLIRSRRRFNQMPTHLIQMPINPTDHSRVSMPKQR